MRVPKVSAGLGRFKTISKSVSGQYGALCDVRDSVHVGSVFLVLAVPMDGCAF